MNNFGAKIFSVVASFKESCDFNMYMGVILLEDDLQDCILLSWIFFLIVSKQ